MTKYITTPIYYLNGDPHIGHAFTTILSDVLKRIYEINKEDCFLTTGTDEHGQKNQSACEKSGLDFETFMKEKSEVYKSLFDRLNIKYDYFVRTSCQQHKDYVKQCLNYIKKKDLIIKKSYTGLYCEGCEQFKKLSDLDSEGNCPDHKKPPQQITEENYFFKLEPFREWLIEFIKQNPEWIQPKVFMNEVLAMLQEPLEDLCISRPKSRVSLGIEFPFDDNYITYIWFDALINYLSTFAHNKTDLNKYWNNSIHLMGKDIIKAHCIYWPIILKALDFEPAKKVLVHGFWLGEGNIKMSKSIGNIVDPKEVIDLVGVDTLRFYLCNTMNGAKDGQVSINLIKNTHNLLGNNLGNLVSRSCKMLEKYCNNKIPTNNLVGEDRELLEKISISFKNKISTINNLENIQELSQLIIETGNLLNGYIDKKEPWKLGKDITKKYELESCLYTLMEGLLLIGCAVYPIMPTVSDKLLSIFNLNKYKIDLNVFKTNILEAGLKINVIDILFPRVE